MVEKQKTKNMIYFCLLLLLKGLVVKYTSYVLLNQKKIRYKIYAHFSNPSHLLIFASDIYFSYFQSF